MTTPQLQRWTRWTRWLHWHTPLVSRPFRRWSIRRLAEARLDAAALPPLIAALDSPDPVVATTANSALRSFDPDALIDHTLAHPEGAALLPIIAECGLRHSVEGRWFLFLVLAGRFDEYLAEDFEFQTLRAEFQAAPPALQGRIRESIVTHGEARMNALFVTEKRDTLLANLSDQDAETLIRINVRNQNWDALFSFLRVFPARHILSAVRGMMKAQWQPEKPDDAALLRRLADLAPQLDAPPAVGHLPLSPLLQKWMASGETDPAPPAALKALLKDETPPPQQIAALGALHKRKALDAATLTAAVQSEHWMVRMVAVHLGAPLADAMKVNDGGKEWFQRLSLIQDAEALWATKPSQVDRDALDALREALALLPNRATAGGLNLVEAIESHYTAHDIELEVGARVLIGEDSFELNG